MENNDTNTQTQPTTPPPPATGNVAELQARITELEKAREGLIRDVQHERTKRQELETRSTSPAPSAAQPDVTEDELGRVLKPYIAPVAKEAAEARRELESLRLEKAQNYLEKKTGKAWDALEKDADFQGRMTQMVRKYGVTGNVYDITVRAYELMQLEDLKTKDEERVRAANVAQTQTLPSGAGPIKTSTAKKYSAEEFNGLSPREFDALSKDGDFRKSPDGSFEYLPR